MKKLIVLLLISLFAAKRIPKYTFNTYATSDKAGPYVYTSRDGKYEYSIIALTQMKLNYTNLIDFRKTTLENNYRVKFLIGFEKEEQLDDFIKKFPLSDIEKEFNRIEKIFKEKKIYVITTDSLTEYHAVGSEIEF
jgi:hypothetical protein